MFRFLYLFTFLLTVQIGFCQENPSDDKAKIASVLENYFDLEREAIHLHLDKTSFITNESIWYRGYIINRKTNKPYFTSNVFVLLYDEKGTLLSEKLVYASNGTFSGKISLNPKMPSGDYYIQVYTNWMNNFSENESTMTKVNIVNPEQGIKNNATVNPDTLTIFLNPEGGNLVAGIENTIGVQIKDCRGHAPKNLEASLLNGNGDVLKTFKLDQYGLGKFEYTPSDTEKVTLKYHNTVYEKSLPAAEPIGFVINANTFTLEGKTIIKVKTNATTTSALAAQSLYLLVHQDQKYSIYNLNFSTALEQTFSLNNTELFEGLNTIRIIDSNMKEWAQRLIYLYPKKESSISMTSINDKTGKLQFEGNSPFQNASMSLSVLPEETKALDENSTIISGLTLNPYLTNPLPYAGSYFVNTGRKTAFNLDIALLNQGKSKYEWNYMKMTTPIANYSFDIGLTLKGTIDNQIKDKPYHKVKLVSYKDFIMMASDIDEKGNYQLDHILLADSTFVKMSLEKLPNFDVVKSKLTPQVLNRKRPFNKPFQLNIPADCPETESDNLTLALDDIPKFASNIIQLKEVKVTIPKKKLLYENRLGNANLRGYKVDEIMERQNLLVFIETNGFNVARNGLNVTIYSRNRNSLNAEQAKPQISIDGRIVRYHDELTLLQMADIDEIYLNPHEIVPGMSNYQGAIKIYTKKNIPNPTIKQDPNSFYITEGFTRYFGFKNADYASTQSNGFNHFGLIHWESKINTDETGAFTIEIPNYNKPKARIVIEGMTEDGRLFHEEKVIDLL